jgi:anti-anti-sigma regulatory factor
MSAMSNRAKVSVARFDGGVCLKVEGAGTMQESPVMHAFAEQVLGQAEESVIVDLASCSYVDSTFLGGLVSLFKRHGAGRTTRFSIYAPPPVRQSLFGTSRLDRVLPFVDDLPRVPGESFPLEPHGTTSREELGQYIVECHRRLAEVGGAEAETFGRVADAIAEELTARRRTE